MATKKTIKKSPKKADNKLKLHLLHQMMRIRRMEEKAYELYTEEKIRGFLHLYDGEEAVAVGVIENLTGEDSIVATYREHGHALIRGVSMERIMAEMFGRQEGCSGGRGGSMHLYDKETNFFGGSAIVGNGLPMAVGVAFAYKRQKKDALVCCFFGEGAVDEGEFHESMNLASLWDLPVLFVCENNLYSMGMPFELAEAETDLVSKAKAYNVEGESVNGMNVMGVREASKKAMNYIRKTQKPYFLECKTYRFRAHSMFDPERYRKKSEVKEWKKEDPIQTFSDKLRKEKVLTDAEWKKLNDKVAEEVEDAVRFAEEGTLEPVEDLTKYVYSDSD
ncbi:MAG TPA: pyruvate dehydrogenase (acetyl-transferring) E1 component subunit alpha [Balneolaceae bacterium]|nr:pyruvate dehydrogenase (acetyl-transferring) E1 component subunit alpha [Balneolaceae bacterium]